MNKNEVSDVTKAYRSAIADRATWFYLLLRAAEEKGMDGEELAKKAITEYGVEKGKLLGEIKNAADFAAALFKGYGCQAFAMEKVKETESESTLHFHHCELVEAWRKKGLSPDEVSRLCRFARYGDLGMVSNFPNLQLAFPNVIADGDDYCELQITVV